MNRPLEIGDRGRMTEERKHDHGSREMDVEMLERGISRDNVAALI